MKRSSNVPFEESAHIITVTGWACKVCGRFFGSDNYTLADGHGAEHMARWCCASSLPCECGGRITGEYTICDICRNKKRTEEWLAKPEVEWDGEFPVAVWDSDRYFWDADDLYEYIHDSELGISGLRLTTCEPIKPREFEMNDFLSDDLPEDEMLNDLEINKVVNAWIESNLPKLWFGTGQRIGLASLIAHFPDLDFEELKTP